MAESWPSAARVYGFAATPCILVSAVGLVVCILPVRTSLAASLRTSVAFNVAQSCGAAIPPSAVQQDAEAQLRGVGVTVSNIHNAQLAADIYCAAIAPGSRSTAVVVQECLGFNELAPAPSNHGRARFATTFRDCQSFKCRGAQCEPLARSRLHTLINAFLSDFEQRNSRNASPAPQIEPRTQADAIPGEVSSRAAGRSIFYLLYIMTCVTVLAYWQLRGHHYRLR